MSIKLVQLKDNNDNDIYPITATACIKDSIPLAKLYFCAGNVDSTAPGQTVRIAYGDCILGYLEVPASFVVGNELFNCNLELPALNNRATLINSDSSVEQVELLVDLINNKIRPFTSEVLVLTPINSRVFHEGYDCYFKAPVIRDKYYGDINLEASGIKAETVAGGAVEMTRISPTIDIGINSRSGEVYVNTADGYGDMFGNGLKLFYLLPGEPLCCVD